MHDFNFGVACGPGSRCKPPKTTGFPLLSLTQFLVSGSSLLRIKIRSPVQIVFSQTICRQQFVFLSFYTIKMTSKANTSIDFSGYKKIKFKITKTNHLLIKATINDVPGNFILDTGASNSCVDFENVTLFKLKAKASKTRAAGAGAIDMLTQTARKNHLRIGRWNYNEFNLVVFDLSHVNTALEQHKSKPVQGIIGADILIAGSAIIDYPNKLLFLK